MKKNTWLVSLILAIFLGNKTFSQNTLKSRSELAGQVNTITTAVPFLLIAPDSRAGGMGDVGAATSPDANSIHWNAAKLAFIEKDMGLSISYTPWLRKLVQDINLTYLSGYKRISDKQAIAMSLLYFSLGNITFTNDVGDPQGDFAPNEFAIDAAFAQKLGENFSGGIALRYIRSDLTLGQPVAGSATSAGNSVAADVSAFYTSPVELGGKSSRWNSGINISNIGSKIAYTTNGSRDFIPTNFRLGTGLTMDLDKFNSFTFTTDINKLLVPTPDPADSIKEDVPVAKGIFSSFNDAPGGFKEEMKEFIYAFGLEYWYDKQFAVRAGYFHESDTKGNRQFITLGAGLKYNIFGLDFAYVIPTSAQNSPLENTLRFSLLFDFDGFGKQKGTEEAN